MNIERVLRLGYSANSLTISVPRAKVMERLLLRRALQWLGLT